jgi:enamine deaminase RidA (YjgF/YER057c/UK114 family)
VWPPRAAIGVSSLPGRAVVELEAVLRTPHGGHPSSDGAL